MKGIRHKEVCFLRIDLMHVYYSMYFYYLLLFVVHVLSLGKLAYLLMYLSVSVMCCISAELLHACQTVGVWIGKCLPIWATSHDRTLHAGFTVIGSSCEI